MADLAHDPLHVKAVGEQRERDVGPAHGVRRGVRQRRPSLSGESLVGKVRRLAEDLAHALSGGPPAATVREQEGVGPAGVAGRARTRRRCAWRMSARSGVISTSRGPAAYLRRLQSLGGAGAALMPAVLTSRNGVPATSTAVLPPSTGRAAP